MATASKNSSGSPQVSTVAAMAPAPLAAAPEQALRAEVSETASEPELLFAPDFIISQVNTSMAYSHRRKELFVAPVIATHLHACCLLFSVEKIVNPLLALK